MIKLKWLKLLQLNDWRLDLHMVKIFKLTIRLIGLVKQMFAESDMNHSS